MSCEKNFKISLHIGELSLFNLKTQGTIVQKTLLISSKTVAESVNCFFFFLLLSGFCKQQFIIPTVFSQNRHHHFQLLN